MTTMLPIISVQYEDDYTVIDMVYGVSLFVWDKIAGTEKSYDENDPECRSALVLNIIPAKAREIVLAILNPE